VTLCWLLGVGFRSYGFGGGASWISDDIAGDGGGGGYRFGSSSQ
jgi:hypothetical protein